MKKCPSDDTPNMIHFTQFLFPDGARVDQWVPRSKEIYDLACDLYNNGFRFEIENNCGKIWMRTIKGEESVDRFCSNGPDVPDKIDEMIKEAHERFLK